MSSQSKKPVICIMGPTASGKTRLSLKLADKFPCEIISVDSAKIYRSMDIGTAKPALEIRKQYPHHLIDICDPSETYSAAQFCHDANRLIEDIHSRNKIPLLVGGTMLYFHTLQNGIADLPKADYGVRESLQKQLEEHGLSYLHNKLQKVDPDAAIKINENDPQRILRALEIYEITGKPMTLLWKSSPSITSHYDFKNLAYIPQDRELLHKLIEKRFQNMLDRNFIDEVNSLYQRKDLHLQLPSIRCVGYRQVWEYLEGKFSHQEMQEKAIIATRQLSKRQITWLRQWNATLFSNDDQADFITASRILEKEVLNGSK